MNMNIFDHIISNIIELEEKVAKQTKLHETKNVHKRFTTLERYPIVKLLILYSYLSDLALDYPFRPESDELFASHNNSTINGRIHTQLKVLERILNLPDEVPSSIVGRELVLINSYGYRSEHCKGRIYGHRNTMTLISRQCRYYLFKGLYFDLDLKNAHPTILMSYAINNNLTVEVLKRYVDNREDFLQDVMHNDNLTRSEAKIAVLRCLNLVSDKSLPNHLKALHKDILIIREHLYKENMCDKLTTLGEYTISRKSFQGKDIERQKISLQAQYCATEESKSLYVLYEVCIQKGLLNKETTLNRKARNISFIPFFDGAYVSFEDLKDELEVNQILEDTNELIYPYSFELKEIEPEWTYINGDTLQKYEKIHHFLGELTDRQYNKLLEILEIPAFSLDVEALDKLENSAKDDPMIAVGAKNKNAWKEMFTDSKYLTELIDETVRLHKYSIRKSLLKHLDEGTFIQIQIELGIVKDSETHHNI